MIKNAIAKLRRTAQRSQRPDVLLHIGAPKCGSSAIQRFCISNREELLSHGFYYPEHPLDVNGVSGGHTQLAAPLVEGKTEEAGVTFRRLLGEAQARGACLLLSAEGLYGQQAAMAEFCKGLRVVILGFLRDPLEALLANHNQGIKRHMSTRRLIEVAPEILRRPTGHLVGTPFLAWADCFGDENCRFLPYRSPGSGGPMIEAEFLNALGLSQVAPSMLEGLSGQTNRSYVKSALELKRLLNTVLPDLPLQHAHKIDWCLQGYSDRALEEAAYTVADLDAGLREKMQKHLFKQMAPVVARFPGLAPVASSSTAKEGTAAGAANWIDLGGPLRALAEDEPQVLRAVRERAVALREQGRRDYVFCKLLDVLGIDFVEPGAVEPVEQPKPVPRKGAATAQLPGLTESQRKVLGSKKPEAVGCMRELAVVLERQDALDDALYVIERALVLRPEGVGLQRIRERIKGKLAARGQAGSARADANRRSSEGGR